jgi:hypothetical protein
MCYYIQKNKVIILLEMNDKCSSNQCPTFEEYKGNNPNYRMEVEHTRKSRKMAWRQIKWLIEPPKDPLANWEYENQEEMI